MFVWDWIILQTWIDFNWWVKLMINWYTKFILPQTNFILFQFKNFETIYCVEYIYKFHLSWKAICSIALDVMVEKKYKKLIDSFAIYLRKTSTFVDCFRHSRIASILVYTYRDRRIISSSNFVRSFQWPNELAKYERHSYWIIFIRW